MERQRHYRLEQTTTQRRCRFNPMHKLSFTPRLGGFLLFLTLLASALPAQAQAFRFSLRAEPALIPANGISTTSIIVQVNNSSSSGISAAPVVRFVTTRGVIERQTLLSNGFGRVLLRSSNTPGIAVITAVMPGGATEQIEVEFTDGSVDLARYMEVAGPYVTYGTEKGTITASGRCTFDLGDTHIESDIRLDVNLNNNRLWAEGNAGGVTIRHGRGAKAKVLKGDRLFYDLDKRRGVIRRIDTTQGPARQEFMGSDFRPLPEGSVTEPKTIALSPDRRLKSGQQRAADENVEGAITVARIPLPDTQKNDAASVNDNTSGPDAMLGVMTPRAVPEIRDNAQLIPAAEPAAEPPVTNDPAPDTGVLQEPSPPDSTIAAPTDALTESSSAAPASKATGETGETVSELPPYQAMNPEQSPEQPIKLFEPPPPDVDNTAGYWVVARRLRVFPHDKIQFENASIFVNGRKAFSMPLYVVSLNGAFNPMTDMMAFNTEGGVTLNVPYYYMATPHGTGTVYLKHAPGKGFSSDRRGFSLAIEQQYWMSNRSHGNLSIDQLGRGAWNLDWSHSLRLSPTLNGNLYLNMPRHRDTYLRGTLDKEFRGFQVGVEGFLSKPDGSPMDGKGQFYARMRPRQLGKTDWVYTLSGNVTAWRRYTEYFEIGGTTTGSGGGIGLPGHTRPGSTIIARTGPLYSQTASAVLQSPTFKLWRGANIQGNLSATAYNYSNNKRGFSPGLTLGLQQKLGNTGSFQVDYSYDRGGLGLFGNSYTNFVSSSLNLNLGKRISSSTSLTRSFSDDSLYAVTALDYYLSTKWRVGLFSDYSSFGDTDSYLNYGWSLGRQIGQRELTLNWDHQRNRVYFQLGNLIY